MTASWGRVVARRLRTSLGMAVGAHTTCDRRGPADGRAGRGRQAEGVEAEAPRVGAAQDPVQGGAVAEGHRCAEGGGGVGGGGRVRRSGWGGWGGGSHPPPPVVLSFRGAKGPRENF